MNKISAQIFYHKTNNIQYPTIKLLLDGKVIDTPLDSFEFAITIKPIEAKFIFTCSCGVAECAGYHFGIKVKKKRNTVEWKFIDPIEARGVNRFYVFDRYEYEQTQQLVLDLYQKVVEELKADTYSPDELEYISHEYNTVEPFNYQVDWYKDFRNNYPHELLTPDLRCA